MSDLVVYRDHALVRVRQHPLKSVDTPDGTKEVFTKPKKWPSLPPDRNIGITQVSQPNGNELHTCLIALDFLDSRHNTLLETAGLENPVLPVLDHILSVRDDDGKPIYAEHIPDSRTRERPMRERNNKKGRDGRRKLPKPFTLISHNWELDLGRLFRYNQQFKRTVRAGQPGITIHIEDWELEITQLNPGGSGCAFTILARKDGLIMRLLGKSIKGHLKSNASDNAASLLDRYDLTIPPDSWNKKQWTSFTPEDMEFLLSYVTTSANIARELYEDLVARYSSISQYVTRRDGTLPTSVAGAGIKIALSKLEVEEFERPSWRVQQSGALIVAGARVFMNIKPGYYENIYQYDGVSWHGFLMGQLPDPLTSKYVDIKPGAFHVEDWLGQYGSTQISGIEHSPDRNRPLRFHDTEVRRLGYIRGTFTRAWAPIPEIVYGVMSGKLTVTHIHDGIHIVGSNENSFLRQFVLDMEAIRRHEIAGSPTYKLIKDATNVVAGKLIQINTGHPFIGKMARGVLMPIDPWRGFKRYKDTYIDLMDAHVAGIEDLKSEADGMYKHSKFPDRAMTFGTFLDSRLAPSATTGAYYLPMHGAQIWGESSARLGLLATATDAISGYADSIITIGDASEGITKYNNMVREFGYVAPETGMGSLQPKITHGYGWILGPGAWAIRYPDIDVETGEVRGERQKNALHNLPELEDASDDYIWNTICHIIESRNHTYTTKARPTTLKEAYKLKVEPGTPVSYSHTFSVSKEETAHDVKRTQKYLQEANESLAHKSSHDIGSTKTALGCVKILISYGYDYDEIASITKISRSIIKDISNSKSIGKKYLEKLQQTVIQSEHSLAS
jgi:hypothetical protein